MADKQMFVITAQDGSQWAVAAEVIADHRAEYYVQNDPATTYQAEFDYAMKDEFELHDWLNNNMNYEDFSEFVRPYQGPAPINLAKAFRDGAAHQSNRPAGLELPVPERTKDDGTEVQT